MTQEKTHYRKAFNSPYLSSADIVEPTVLTIAHVALESDKSKKTKDEFNTVYFVEKEIRQGEQLKPMILNAVNSRTLKALTGSPWIEDWKNIPVTIYVDHNVRFGRDMVEGLRISTERPQQRMPVLKEGTPSWDNAVAAFQRDGNLDAVTSRVIVSTDDMEKIKQQASA